MRLRELRAGGAVGYILFTIQLLCHKQTSPRVFFLLVSSFVWPLIPWVFSFKLCFLSTCVESVLDFSTFIGSLSWLPLCMFSFLCFSSLGPPLLVSPFPASVLHACRLLVVFSPLISLLRILTSASKVFSCCSLFLLRARPLGFTPKGDVEVHDVEVSDMKAT